MELYSTLGLYQIRQRIHWKLMSNGLPLEQPLEQTSASRDWKAELKQQPLEHESGIG